MELYVNKLNSIALKIDQFFNLNNEILETSKKVLLIDITENTQLINYIKVVLSNEMDENSIHENFIKRIVETDVKNTKKELIKKIEDLIEDYKGFYKELFTILNREKEMCANENIKINQSKKIKLFYLMIKFIDH